MDGEADLWAAVVRLALADACGDTLKLNKHRTPTGSASSLEALQAWRFCTATSGGWAESREMICGMCGVDPDVLRQEALQRGPGRGVRVQLARMAEARARLPAAGVAAGGGGTVEPSPEDVPPPSHVIRSRHAGQRAA